MNIKNKELSLTKVAHLIYRFDIGGLERVLVNCINKLPDDKYQHIIIALTDISSTFASQLDNKVQMIALNKKEGADLGIHLKLKRILKNQKIDIFHTYNLATIEYHPVAKLAGIKAHVHAEHGRDIYDPEGLNWKHNLLRKLISPFIDYFVPVSADLKVWLEDRVGINKQKIKLIYNGIDLTRFSLKEYNQNNILKLVTVARLSEIKDQATLIHGFAKLVQLYPDNKVKLDVIGDGPMFNQLKSMIEAYQLEDQIRLLGARNDIPEILNAYDVFVLTSLAEGIPMTILEAMATGLAIVSTSVGGIPEIIQPDVHGALFPKTDAIQLSQALKLYIDNPTLAHVQGRKGRDRVIELFNEDMMVKHYHQLYQEIRKS